MATPSDSTAAQVPADLVRRELEALLSSSTFAGATRLSRFLRYVVEQTLQGGSASLKEYQLGIEVFDRPETYDTRTDPVVRVEARQLRFKLADYYAGPGREDQVIISLPKGRYAASFEMRAPEAGPTPAHNVSSVLPAAPVPAIVVSNAVPSVAPALHKANSSPTTSPEPSTAPRSRPIRWLFAALILCALGLLLWRLHPFSLFAHRTDPEARNLYFKGRYYWNRRTAEDLTRSIDYFTQAIVKDPTYAQAYVGLADAYNLLSEFSVVPYREAFAHALPAAQKAVELDPNSAEAHTALAFSSYWGAWDPLTADREFRRALQLNPSYARAHHWYATFLLSNGRFAEALAQINRAQELEPASSAVLADEGLILWYQGESKQAIRLLKQLEASEPSFISPHEYLATICLIEGDYPNYIAEVDKLAALLHDAAATQIAQAAQAGYLADGGHGLLERVLAAEQQQSKPITRSGNYLLARVCLLLGNRNQAIQYLSASISNHETSVLFLPSDPFFRSLRDDPAFHRLVLSLPSLSRSS